MRFTGNNLLLVYRALIDHEAETRNMIVTAPDHELESDAYKEYVAEHKATEKLLATVRMKFETKENP